MFWRNNYLNNETFKEYLNSNDRTQYTYSESRSYREKPIKQEIEQPKLFRHAIHINNIDSIENDDQSRDFAMMSKPSNTQRQKKAFISNNKRVLRSRASLVLDSNKDSFVKEVDLDDDVKTGYHIGLFNSNTNNSGPEESQEWKVRHNGHDYHHLSGDEDIASDVEHIVEDKQPSFGTNNANVNNSQKRVSNQWFQKNMFGLPNDESDEMQPDFSGAISGDEQFDIASFQNSNTFQKSRQSKLKSKRSVGSESHLLRSDSMMCSPVAVISSIFEYLWLIVVSTVTVFSRTSRSVIRYSNSPRWFLLPLYLPTAIASSTVSGLLYSMNRVFGTSSVRRWLSTSNSNKEWSFFRLLFKTLWLLFWMTMVFIAMRMLMRNGTSEISISSPLLPEHVSESLFNFAGKECMEANECCHNTWEFVRRFTFCTVSLPTRWIRSNMDEQSKDHEESQIIIKSNISDFNNIIFQLQSRLKSQEEMIKKYFLKLSNLEKVATSKITTEKNRDEKILNLNNEMKIVTSKLEQLQMGLNQLNSLKGLMEGIEKKTTEARGDSIRLVTSDIEKLRHKLEEDMKLMHTLVDKSDSSSKSNSEDVTKLEKLLVQVQGGLSKLTVRLDDINAKTNYLESSTQRLELANGDLKKDMIKEIQKEISSYKYEQSLIVEKLNAQMSKLEESLEKDYSKLLDKEYLGTLIEAHLDNFESNIVNEVNSTMWSTVKERARYLVESLTFQKLEQTPSNLASQSCRCPAAFCRRQASCVRLSQIRKMLNDALNLYSADKIGLADFALESAGGTIATIRCTETYTDRAATLTIFGIPLLRLTNSPRTIIQPSINPGECWAMKGSKGSVVVQLSGKVLVDAVSIDHIPKSLSPSGSIDSAIKDFEIKALTEVKDILGQSLGNFTYSMESAPVQTFHIKTPITTSFVEMIVHSNYGNEEYTCIYRLRVHGTLVK